MKAIVRNVLLACLISTFALFGALGRGPVKQHPANATIAKSAPVKPSRAETAESRKETLTCLGVAFLAWVLCFWRCGVINRRLNEEREYESRFNEYMRNSSFNRQYY
jgi:hypothetical protein